MARAFRGSTVIADESVRGLQRCLPAAGRPASPNVLYVVWDDAGIASWDCFGGLIETPHMKWLAARGLRYSQWHTTVLSSSTRYSLLTGRNCGASDIATADEGGHGFRDRAVAIPQAAGTLAEILAETGYRSYCLGKWHLSPSEPAAVDGSRQSWPLGRGFNHYYGFLGAQTSQLYPDLVYDNQYVDPPYSPTDGYHLSADLAEMAIEFIRGGIQTSPAQSWFCYLSFGANNAPNAVPPEWAERYSGRFEMGYERYREMVLASMKKLGVVPGNTGLAAPDCTAAGGAAARGSAVPSWQSLTDEQKRSCNRAAESQAALCSYTDHQIGRVLGFLHESGQLDDTIVVVCSADTTDAEAAADGSLRPGSFALSPTDFAGSRSGPGDLAAAANCADHAAGWAHAFRTPYSMLRQSSPGGCAASPLIISWPRQMQDAAGGVRDQYHHAVDIVPTILDCAAIDPPRLIKDCPQAPIEGVSMRYTFAAPGAPSRRRTQLYESPGARAIYHDGWRAMTAADAAAALHGGPTAGWDLYHVSADRTEMHEVSARYPGKTAELVSLFAAETIAAAPGHEVRLLPVSNRTKEPLASSRLQPAVPPVAAARRRHTATAHGAAPVRIRAGSRASGTASRPG